MIRRFTDTIYHHCASQHGVKEQKTRVLQPKKNKRQRRMDAIRNQNRLQKQWKKAPGTEKAVLRIVLDELRDEHGRLWKAERARKKTNKV